MRAKRLLIIIAVVVAAILVSLFLYLSQNKGGNADISEYGDDPIRISGLLDEDFFVTPNELSEMKCVSEVGVKKTDPVFIYGPTLETFVAEYGKTLDEFYSVSVYAYDHYSVTLGKATWNKYDVILSISDGDEPLAEDHRPLQLAIPGAKAHSWVYQVKEIEFTYLSDVS